jgi:hypothetical protein
MISNRLRKLRFTFRVRKYPRGNSFPSYKSWKWTKTETKSLVRFINSKFRQRMSLVNSVQSKLRGSKVRFKNRKYLLRKKKLIRFSIIQLLYYREDKSYMSRFSLESFRRNNKNIMTRLKRIYN